MSTEDRLNALEKAVTENTTMTRMYMRSSDERDTIQHDINNKLFHLLHEQGKTIHGVDNEPGLKGRIDRVEQRGKLTTWIAGTAIAAWLGALVKWASNYV